MSVEADTPSIPLNDLPPQTWRSWWLDWPKWFRIGCWAALGVILLHVALAIRIYIGLIEPAEIQALRRRGVQIVYLSDRMAAPYPGYRQLYQIRDGLKGRSCDDVVEIGLNQYGTDNDLKLIGRHFPNLIGLHLHGAEISNEGLKHLWACRRLQELRLTYTDVDDACAELFLTLPKLGIVELTGTLVTDATLLALKKVPLIRRVDVAYTDVSLPEIQDARRMIASKPGQWIGTEKDQMADAVLGSIRWSDGKRSAGFHGNYVIGWEVSRSDRGGSGSQISCGLTRLELWWPTNRWNYGDGDYSLELQLGEYVSEPVVVTIQDGKPATHSIEFRMPVTKAEALRSDRE